MASSDNPREIQESELSSLKYIYEDQVIDLRKPAAWNKWQPLDIVLSLGPSRSASRNEEAYVCIQLHIICQASYPKELPTITVTNKRGVSDVLLNRLQDELCIEAKRYEGQEMIFPLAQYVEGFLYKHNTPPGPESFYAEMIKNNQDEEQKKKEEQKLADDMRKMSIQEEISRRKCEQELTKQISFKDNSSESEEDSSISTQTEAQDHGLLKQQCPQHTSVEKIEFANTSQEIYRGSCIRHVDENCVMYQCLDKFGCMLCLTEWKIDKKKVDVDSITRKVIGIQLEVTNKLTKLKHENLCSYIDFEYSDTENYIHILLLSEYARSPTLSLLSEKGPIELEYIVKHVAQSVLAALSFLHKNNVVHKDLSPDCVFIDNTGCVKVSNYSIQKKIRDFLGPPPETPPIYNKRTDVYNFGVLLLSILKGEPVVDNNITIPPSLHPDLYDFLHLCLGSRQLRPTASKLLKDKFLQTNISEKSSIKRSTSGLVRTEEHSEDLKNVLQTIQVHDNCRIKTEFDVLGKLGEGAFGHVLEVKNKLDGNLYAVKVIKLKAQKTALLKKIIREVKLLSRLNHENIVRYYHSWIEAAPFQSNNYMSNDQTPSKLTVLSGDAANLSRVDNKSPHIVQLQDCTPESLVKLSDGDDEDEAVCEDDDDDTEDDDNENNADNGEQKTEVSNQSDSIVFQEASNDDDSFIQFEEGEASRTEHEIVVKPNKNRNTPSILTDENGTHLIQTLYIQMELCEKNSLRNAIDKKMYKGGEIWKLFREIVEGIAYIHEQGMMHRDLKPDNIFLDMEGRVKIGDFGLAKHIVSRKLEDLRVDSDSEYPEDDKKTGAIGTALYIAPELNNASSADYNEKVDIYSLGIILFEMLYPFDTKMERVKKITDIRSKEIKFPEDFEGKNTEIEVIRRLLNHDSTKRPTSQELLKSHLLPLPEVEDGKMRELIEHAMKNPQSKSYKHLISSCFQQKVTSAQDLMYDRDESFALDSSSLQLHTTIKQIVINIFKRFGGIELSTPALLPKCKFYEGVDSCVRLMSHDGVIVSLPHDLRVPFARYVAWNGLTSLRRYSIEKVYREEKIFGFRPLETWECCFDVVTKSGGIPLADAEILYICYKILSALKVESDCLVRLNHTLLFEAILMQHEIMDKKDELLNVFANYQEGNTLKGHLKELLVTYDLRIASINPLLNLFNSDISDITKLPSILANMRKKSNKIGKMTRTALEQLKLIVSICADLGAKIDTVLRPGLLHQASQYDGMIFQIVCGLKRKHKQVDVIASGGRYDAALDHYRTMMVQAGYLAEDVKPKAVGVSLSLNKLCQVVRLDFSGDQKKVNMVGVIVCSVGSTGNNFATEKINILSSLRCVGINCFSVECTGDDEVRDQCARYNTQHAILLTDSARESVKLRTFERDNRFRDIHVKTIDIVAKVQAALKSNNIQENNQTGYSRSDSKSSNSDKAEQILVHFIQKQSPAVKKKVTQQLQNTFDKLLTKLKCTLVIIVHDYDMELMNTVAQLSLSSDEHYQTSLKNILERNPKHRKYLESLCEEMHSQKKQNPNAAIMLYSFKDSSYKMCINY